MTPADAEDRPGDRIEFVRRDGWIGAGVVVTVEPDGLIVRVRDPAERLVRVARANVIRRPVSTLELPFPGGAGLCVATV